MILFRICLPGQPPRIIQWEEPSVTFGRGPSNQMVLPLDNISVKHARITQSGNDYLLQDLGSTNGTVLWRGETSTTVERGQAGIALAPGDRICLANPENQIIVDFISGAEEEAEDPLGRTILAEQPTREGETERALGDDFEALQCVVRLAREMVGLDSVHDIAALTVSTCLRAFPKARAAFFLTPLDAGWHVEAMELRKGESGSADSRIIRSQKLIDRCLAERKGFLFLFEHNRMQVMATRLMAVEKVDTEQQTGDRVILCCPLFRQDRCHGFIEVDAPLPPSDKQSLSRRDLSLATVMAHLVAGRMHDLENQRERLKLARKATAGFLAATVGHCFKNLLFVPMSISHMLPVCIKTGQMDEVEWMLARNNVSIRYLDMLSNEFAAASKDPTEGFNWVPIGEILNQVAELVGQISPDKVMIEVATQPDLPSVWCHGHAIKRLLMNLVLNAVDAIFGMPDGSPMGHITLRAVLDAHKNELCIMVQDNGPGIPKPILENLREIFRRVQSSADALSELQSIAETVQSTKNQGYKEHYGLGFLFVCQTIQQHRGRLAIDAEPGKGSRFVIAIPMKSAEAITDEE